MFTRIWLALFGLWSWDDLPVIPPELIYLPSWFPLNIYDWGCWARQTIVALAVVPRSGPRRPLGISIDELKTGGPQGRAPRPRRDRRRAPAGRPGFSPRTRVARLHRLDRPCTGTGGPVKSVRRAALRRCAEWIIARQEEDGCWGGIQPPWVYSLMALNLLGYDLDHPVMAKGLAGLDRFTITEANTDGPVRRLEACQSPVWDTVLAMIALADAGLPPEDPALTPRRTLGARRGDPRPGRLAGPPAEPRPAAAGRSSSTTTTTPTPTTPPRSSWRCAASPRRDRGAIDRGLAWLTGMQSKDGGWGAFDADNTRNLVNKLPFCDFGAVIDPPSADVTAHIVEALRGRGPGRLARRRAAA